MYTVILLPLRKYIAYRIKRHGFLSLLKLTDSGYPQILALGVCYYRSQELVVCTVGNWKLRLEHEDGHRKGLNHVPIWKVGYVMHPWGIFRGKKY